MEKSKISKVYVTIDYVDKFVFDDMYEASSFMTLYTKATNIKHKFDVQISFEEVEDPVYSEPAPTKGVDC